MKSAVARDLGQSASETRPGPAGVSPIHDAARQAFEQAGQDAYKAAKLLEQRAESEQPLMLALVRPLLHQACYDAIREVCRNERGYIAKQADNVLAMQASDGAGRIKSHATRLMAFLLPLAQKPLGEATRAEVEANASFYARQAKTMESRARWLALIAEELKGKRKVKNALDEARLMALWEQAR